MSQVEGWRGEGAALLSPCLGVVRQVKAVPSDLCLVEAVSSPVQPSHSEPGRSAGLGAALCAPGPRALPCSPTRGACLL